MLPHDDIKLIVKIVISFLVLICAFLLAFCDYPKDYVKWSFGFIGLIVGYWLK